jgi:methionine-gamma-lyase
MNKSTDDHHFDTRLLHVGHQPDPTTRALASPIYQTSTFAAKSAEHFDQMDQSSGYVYSRSSNPTLRELELKLAMLEGGEEALVTASGMGAITSTMLALLKPGDHIISAKGIYSHTEVFFKELLGKFGVNVTFTDMADINRIKSSVTHETRIIYCESPLNPSLQLIDIQALAEICRSNGIIMMVDSTFAPPPIQHPLKLGADLCVHSLTKYLNGHGDALGGAVIGSRKLLEKIKFPGMPCFTGAALSPMNAWMITRGLKTLRMRVETHCENAMAVALFLNEHPYTEFVNYPALESHPQHDLCTSQMNGLGGGVISFKLRHGICNLNSEKASRRFLDSLKLCSIAVSLGEEFTLAFLAEPELVRVAVGLESSRDIINDFAQALDRIAS